MAESSEPSGAANTNIESMTRDQMLARAVSYMQEQQKQHPGTFFSSGWWVPAVTLGVDVQERIDKEKIEKLNRIVQSCFERKFAPQAIEELRIEGRKMLAEQPDMLEQFETIFGNREAWDRMHKHALSEAEKSKKF